MAGVAAGGGFGLDLACDFRFAAENARMGLVFI
ncbi:enoyl-CoA hydratase-related protein [Thermodesulfobacteriota bacterium]